MFLEISYGHQGCIFLSAVNGTVKKKKYIINYTINNNTINNSKSVNSNEYGIIIISNNCYLF